MSRQDNAPGASAAIGAALYGLATRAARRLPRDMSLTSAATLATLDRTGPRRITDLAAVEGVTQPAMTTLVRVMEESGLVERRGDASDKRVTLVFLTEAGCLLRPYAASGGRPRVRAADRRAHRRRGRGAGGGPSGAEASDGARKPGPRWVEAVTGSRSAGSW